MAGGPNCCWKGLWKEARGQGQEGWAKGGGVRGWGKGGKGGGIYIKMKFSNKTGIVRLILVIGMHITRQNLPKSHFLGGFPNFCREFPCNDIIISEKCHVLAPKQDCERFHPR